MLVQVGSDLSRGLRVDEGAKFSKRSVKDIADDLRIEDIVPQLAYKTNRTFVLATTEYRNRQETYREIINTLIKRILFDKVNVMYVPSARESYADIPQLGCDDSGTPVVTTPDDDETVCQTFATDSSGSYIHNAANEIDQLIGQGSTTGAIHKVAISEWEQIVGSRDIDYSDAPLPCQRKGADHGFDPADPEPACRHRSLVQDKMEKIENDYPDIIICGASLPT